MSDETLAQSYLEEKWAKEAVEKPVTRAPLSADEKAQIKRTIKRFFQQTRATIARRAEMDVKAHALGVRAKRQGWQRVSPFYEDYISDRFWFAGYDGQSWEDAKREFALAAGELQPA